MRARSWPHVRVTANRFLNGIANLGRKVPPLRYRARSGEEQRNLAVCIMCKVFVVYNFVCTGGVSDSMTIVCGYQQLFELNICSTYQAFQDLGEYEKHLAGVTMIYRTQAGSLAV